MERRGKALLEVIFNIYNFTDNISYGHSDEILKDVINCLCKFYT